MFLHARQDENLDKKIYRFALFGMPGSGKTCVLTAMGMVCRPTTDGSCCSFLPAHRLASPEVQEGWATLKEYAWSLSKEGELPNPNEVKRENYPRYRYVYTDPKIGTTYFEIINYAGWLTHHSHFRHEDSAELLEHLTEHDVDAIIVLVSAPKEGQEQSDIPDEIATISKAFNFMLSQQAAECRYPIALALTKWDRRWERNETIPPNDADAEAGRIAQFMKQCTAYQTVRDILEKFAGEGSFKMFPVSALGRCSDGRSPDIVPLESYGLPFVFGWLFQSVNDSDFHRFEIMQSELPSWLFRPRLPFVASWKWGQPIQKTWSFVDQLLERLPEMEEKKRVAVIAAKERFMRTWRTQLTGFVATVLLLFVIGTGGTIRTFDTRMLADANTIISNPARTPEDLKRIEKNLVGYVRSPILPPVRTKTRKDEARNLLERIYGLDEGEDDPLRARRAVNIKDEIATIEALVAEEKAAKLWTQINNLPIPPIENNAEIQKLGQQYLDAFPIGKNRADVIAFMNEAQRLYNENVAAQEWSEFERSVRTVFEEGNVSTALSILVGREIKDAEWTALCREMLAETTETTRRRIVTFGTQYDRINNEIRLSQSAVRQLSNHGVSQADEVLREFETLSGEIAAQEDEFHYARVKNIRTRAACDDYLGNAPTQAMKQYVTNYLQYIDQMAGVLNPTVTVSLSVGDRIFSGGSNEFTLCVGDMPAITIADLNPLGFNSNKTIEFANKRFPIKGKLTDAFKFHATIQHKSSRFRDQGSGTKIFTIRELRQGVNLTLTSKNDMTVRHKLILKADGFPVEPELPEWKPLSAGSNE